MNTLIELKLHKGRRVVMVTWFTNGEEVIDFLKHYTGICNVSIRLRETDRN